MGITEENQENINNSKRIWNPVFISACIVNFLMHLCTIMTTPISAKFAYYLGAPETTIGLVAGIFGLSALLFKIVSAPAIDTFNRKSILTGSLVVIFIAFVGYSFSNSVPMLISSRLLQGAGQAFATTCCMTIASLSLPSDKMATGISLLALTTALAGAIAPAIGLKLIEIIGYSYTFAAFAGLMIIAVAVAAAMKISHTRVRKFKITLNSIIAKECLIPAAIMFLLVVASANINPFIALFAGERGIGSDIGYFFTVYAGTMLFTRPLIGKLADKFGPVKVMIPSFICFAAAFLIISISDSLPMFLIAAVISAFGYGGCAPTIQAICLKSVPKERRGAASCTSYIGLDMGQLVGPWIAGAIIESIGYTSMWMIMLAPVSAAIAFTLIFRHNIINTGKDKTDLSIHNELSDKITND